jgi:type II secretory pathway pseudopilin PulG
MARAQGSLEYLILIAVALAVISVVTMIAVGNIGSQQGKYSFTNCQNAAANCKAALAANYNDQCSYCDTECTKSGMDISPGAWTCCKLGIPEGIYEGSTGSECQGCLDDRDCARHDVCNPITKQCVTPACWTDNDCQDPNPATTGDGACVSRLCVNPTAYNAYCATKNEPAGTVCQTTTGAWTCLDIDTAQQTTTTTKCDGFGSCNVAGSKTTTKDCQLATQVDACTSPIPGYEGQYGYNLQRNTTTYTCNPATLDQSTGGCGANSPVIEDHSCEYWYCLCSICEYKIHTCQVPTPTMGCNLRGSTCMDCTSKCGVEICLTSALCSYGSCNYCR